METPQQSNKLYRIFSEKNLTYLAGAIIILGIVLRLVFYLQNRCLFIDEANVTRNIYERGFMALTKPLSYEQFAPPVFLWIIKCFSLAFGFSEFSLRAFQLLCGIASLFLLYSLLKRYAGNNGIWYGLLLFAVGAIYIRYSSELKQYMCDVLVILTLMLLALRTNIETMPRARFILFWSIVGSVGIWFAMPAVFMLAGIFTYYAYISIQSKKYGNIALIAIPGVFWVIQFTIYYFVILKPEIEIGPLQDFHKDGFLYAFPFSKMKWDHNRAAFDTVLSVAAGETSFSAKFHVLAMIAGIIFLVRQQTAKGFLLIVPMLAVCFACTLHQYTLTPRLILFGMPLVLMLITTGFSSLLRINFMAVKVLCVCAALYCGYEYGYKHPVGKSFDTENMTENLVFLQQQGITAKHLYVQHAGVPAYLYYTVIHPKRDRYKDLANAYLLGYSDNYDSISQSFTGKSALLCGWQPEDDNTYRRTILKRHHKEIMENRLPGSNVFIYE